MVENFDSIAYIVTAIVTLVGGWYTIKIQGELNSNEIKSLKDEIKQEIYKYENKINTIFKRLDEQRDDIQNLKTQSTHFLTLKDVRDEHPTSKEFNQLRDSFIRQSDKIDKIYDLLVSSNRSKTYEHHNIDLKKS